MKKKRLDIRCVELRIFESRQKAQRAIMAGDIIVNGNIVYDASFMVKNDDKIELKNKMPYVSRGGLKLKAAIDYFNINLKDKICLDVGVATGGFSDCMLQEGARKVYGVDVGKGQVHEKLLKDPKFIFIPNTNARFLKKNIFDDEIDFAAVDVSFISLKLIIKPVLDVVKDNGEIVFLIKPQFELTRMDLKKGVVKNEFLRKKVLDEIYSFLLDCGNLTIVGYIESPIKGISGNKEFLLYILKDKK